MLLNNLRSPQSWLYVFATLGVLPAMAIAFWSRWPPVLRAWFWALIPVWFLIHGLAAVAAEARLFLVPQVLVFIPGALHGIASRDRRAGPALDDPRS